MAQPSYETGTWSCICDRCGFRYKNYELKREWTGLMVCSKCFEVRHEQDFVRGVPDGRAVPWARPEATDSYVNFVVLGDENPLNGQSFSNVSNASSNSNWQYQATTNFIYQRYNPISGSYEYSNIKTGTIAHI